MTPKTTNEPGTLQRFIGRLKHGLLIQEILDRLMRHGLVIYPYLVTTEHSADAGQPPDSPYVVRQLQPQDAVEIARITIRQVSETSIINDLAKARCFGIFDGSQLAGYTWVSTRHVPVPASRGVALYELNADEAYLYDMFISPDFRGGRLAPLLRKHVLQQLVEEGRTQCYSITLLFNRSSRRFKARFGAREVELRLYLHLRVGGLQGVDLRLWRRRPHLRTRLAQKVAAYRKGTSGG
jgi:GNAT superfamily N-acetyltransferase